MKFIVAGWLGAASCTQSHAAEAPQPIPLPDGWGIHATGTAQAVLYVEWFRQNVNPVHRKTIEGLCGAMRREGMTDKTPKFEEGDGQPLHEDATAYSNGSHYAYYGVVYAYACDYTGIDTKAPDSICGCTHKTHVHHRAQIVNNLPGGREQFDLDFEKKVARRTVSKGSPDLSYRALENGRVQPKNGWKETGRDVVAGIPCVAYRQSVTNTADAEMCVIEADNTNLPEPMRSRQLSGRLSFAGQEQLTTSTRAKRVLLHGLVDSAIFAIPEGFTIQESK